MTLQSALSVSQLFLSTAEFQELRDQSNKARKENKRWGKLGLYKYKVDATLTLTKMLGLLYIFTMVCIYK